MKLSKSKYRKSQSWWRNNARIWQRAMNAQSATEFLPGQALLITATIADKRLIGMISFKKRRALLNPVFIFLVLIGLAAVWFLSSFLYKPIGRFFCRIWKDATDEINEENESNKENESEEK